MSRVQFEIIDEGDAPIVKATLPAGVSIFADSGAMMSMTPGIAIESSLKGGMMGALSRSLLRGETFFYLTLTAGGAGGEALLAPAMMGGIQVLELTGTEYFLQKGSFLAAEHDVAAGDARRDSTGGRRQNAHRARAARLDRLRDRRTLVDVWSVVRVANGRYRDARDLE